MRRLWILPLLLAVAGCSKIKNSTFYKSEYTPPRQFESSVLNEPDARVAKPNAGRAYRIAGDGYGPLTSASDEHHS